MMNSLKLFVWGNKRLSGVIAIAFVGVFYFGYLKFFSSPSIVRYVTSPVSKGTLVISVSGTGQVSAYNQVDLKPKASGDIVWVGVKAGDFLYAGQAIAQVDNTDAKQAVLDLEQSIAQKKLQFQKDSAQAPIDYQKSLESLADANADIITTYNDTFNTLSSAYLDLPGVVTGMQNILYGYDLSSNRSQWNIDVFRSSYTESDTIKIFSDIAERDYKIARVNYDEAILDYKKLTRLSSKDDIEKQLISSVVNTTAVAQAIQSELNILDAVVDDAVNHNRVVSPIITTMRNNARSYLGTANSNLSALLKQQRSLDSAKKIIRDNERNIEIYKIGNPTGSNPISLQSSEYSIGDEERKLQNLKDDLSKYVITAPFSGTLASLDLKRFDTVSTGSTVGTIITKQKIAEISLNELDVARVKSGQKVSLTFDAIPELTIAGSVAEVDSIGTVSQGVVTYIVKISFDSQDDRVKTAMSVSASIVTDSKNNVFLVPNSAVKSQGNRSYVEIPSEFDRVATLGSLGSAVFRDSVREKIVETGASNDDFTEITKGLEEGDVIVTRKISSTSARAVPSQTGSLRIPGVSNSGSGTSGARNGGVFNTQAR